MKPSVALQANRAAIRSVVERHRARNARVFGSVLHGDDQEGSDLDLLIDPKGLARQIPWPGLGRGGTRMNKALRVPDYLGHILEAIGRIGEYVSVQRAESPQSSPRRARSRINAPMP